MSNHLSRSGIPEDILTSEENLIPLRQASAFVKTVSHREGVDSLGLLVGCQTSMVNFGLFGDILCRALTLKDLLDRLVRWIPAVDSGATVWLENSNDNKHIRLCLRHHTGAGRDIIDGYAVFLLLDSVRLAAGSDWRPKRIWLDSEAGKNLSRYEALSEADANRTVDFVAIEISKALLPHPVTPPRGRTNLSSDPESNYLDQAPARSLEDSIAQAIRYHFGKPAPTIKTVSELAGASVRTLQRRLSASGQNYTEILDRVRYDETMELIAKEKPSFSEISRHLGYSDPAHFTHAFRRWTGVSPKEYVERRNRI